MTTRFPYALALALACVLPGVSPPASAQEAWTTKPVRIVAPFPAGGATDAIARLVAARLAEVSGGQVIVENRPGGGGNVGAEVVSKAAPDGATLLLGGGNLVHNPIIRGERAVHPLTGLAPVARVVIQPVVISTGMALPARTIGDAIELARRDPGRVSFSTTGVGTTPHVAAVMLARSAGVEMLHVPYSGGSTPHKDVMSGEVSLSFSLPAVVVPLITQDKLRGLAVSGPQRLATLPALPTLAEAGYAGVDIVSWYGLFAPPGTAPDVVARIDRATARLLAEAETRAKLEQLGTQAAYLDAAAFADALRGEFVRLTPVITSLGIKVE